MGYTHTSKPSGVLGLFTGAKAAEVQVASAAGALYHSGVALTATGAELNQYSVNAYQADAGTAGSVYVVVPHAGTIAAIYATNYAANATTKTVLTAKIATVAVTMPAFEIAVTQAAGTASSTVPTAANTLTAGQVLELISDGGTSTVMPVMYTILVTR